MKTGLIPNFSALVILVLAVVFFAGCATTKPIDWNSRVGSYTFDQAVTELGPPDKQAKLSDGKTVAQWITHREGGTSLASARVSMAATPVRCRSDRRHRLQRPDIDTDFHHQQRPLRVVQELLKCNHCEVIVAAFGRKPDSSSF